MRFWLAILVASLILVSGGHLEQPSAGKYVHPGTIVDAYSHKGLLAEAYAYGSESPNSANAGCPVYSDLLDSQKSSERNGSFDFHIDAVKSSYVAAYCQTEYAARTETANDNSVDGKRVQPDPITLYPKSVPGVGSVDVATVAISTDLDGLRSNFSYYRESNPSAFDEALRSRLSPDDNTIVTNIMKMLRNPSSEQLKRVPSAEVRPVPFGSLTKVEDAQVAYVVITKDLNHARSDIAYYARADHYGYSQALETKFSTDERRVIETIRTSRKGSVVVESIPAKPLEIPSVASDALSAASDVHKEHNCIEMTSTAWDLFNKADYSGATKAADRCIAKFKADADADQSELASKRVNPQPIGKVSEEQKNAIFTHGVLNDVATCFWIKGRSMEKLHRTEQAIEAYKATAKYSYARTFDTKGWFWSPAKDAIDRLQHLEGNTQ
jgi:hypothetical protein